MQVIINNASDLNEGTRQVVLDKVNKLATYYDRIERAEVYLKEDDGSAKNGHTVEVRLHIPGDDLFADYTDPGIERAIDRVTEALRKQLKRHKEKLNERDRESLNLPPMGPNDDVDTIITSEEQL